MKFTPFNRHKQHKDDKCQDSDVILKKIIFFIMNSQSDKVKVLDKNVLQSLKSVLDKKGITLVILTTEKAVKDFINKNIPDECIVGLGDSITTCKLNIRNILSSKGSKIFYSWDGSENYNRSLDTFDTAPRPDYYLSRVNAVNSDGEIMMKDYSKQAATDGLFPKQVFAFAGFNRYCEIFDSRDSILKYTIIKEKPANAKFTLALLPFLNY
jgi:hypothetical protein